MLVCYYPLVFSSSANECTGTDFHPTIPEDRTTMSGGNDELFYKSYQMILSDDGGVKAELMNYQVSGYGF